MKKVETNADLSIQKKFGKFKANKERAIDQKVVFSHAAPLIFIAGPLSVTIAVLCAYFNIKSDYENEPLEDSVVTKVEVTDKLAGFKMATDVLKAISEPSKPVSRTIENPTQDAIELIGTERHTLYEGTVEDLNAVIDGGNNLLGFCDILKMNGIVRSFKREWIMHYRCTKGDFDYSNTVSYNFNIGTKEPWEVRLFFDIDKSSGYKVEYDNRENYVSRVGASTISRSGSAKALSEKQLSWVNDRFLKLELPKNLQEKYDLYMVDKIL